MSFLMAKKFALKNLKANKVLEIPFVLSSGIMFILFNIMVSLASNSYVIHRHKFLISIINMGIVIVGILAVIFVLYSVSVLLKRKNKTLALYSILGLEKKHIRKIISIEFMYLFTMILAIATVGGYIFGQLAFLGLNYLMRDMGVNVMHYPLSILAIVLTMVVVIILYIITVIRLSFTVYISTPTELLNKQHSGEGEPKSRYLVLLFGLITLSAGYWIALTTKGTLESITNFFTAVLLVIFATYALYVALTVVALKLQKKHSSYFKPVKFLSVSGLLYRIKSNALSLASIAILGSGVIVTLSAVTMIYYSANMNFKNAIPRSYELISGENIDLHNYKKVSNTLKKQVEKTVDNKSQVVHSYVGYNCESWCEKKGDQLKILNNESLSSRTSKMLYVGDLVGYNANLHKKIELQDDEILLCNNRIEKLNVHKLRIGGRTFKVRTVDNFVPANVAIESYGIIVKDLKTMLFFSKLFVKATGGMATNAKISCSYNWDVKGISYKKYSKRVHVLSANKVEFVDAKEFLTRFYEINGGFLFIGIIIGIIFLVGTILIIYYKQVSAGYEDRHKFRIMKEIGLEDALIKKSNTSQLMLLLYSPLCVSIIHCIVASKIVFNLVQMFGGIKWQNYNICLAAVIAIFFIIYLLVFKITSRIYYNIVR